jgi:hypothetical protein
MSTALYADHEGDNISWAGDDLPGWEPWEPDEDEGDQPSGGCHYCGTFESIRENPEPFGGKKCCEGCFNEIIGGDREDEPWRCGNAADPYPEER